MSIFASAKWDSDSDTPNSDTLQAITSNIFKDQSGENHKRKLLKRTKSNKNSKNAEKVKPDVKKKNKNVGKIKNHEKTVSDTDKSLCAKSLSQKKKSDKLRNDTKTKQKNVEQEKLASNSRSKLDTALRKVALYKGLKMIQKAEQNKTQSYSQEQEPKKNKRRKKLLEILEEENAKKKTVLSSKVVSLKQRMEERLKAARFRFLNEQIYNTSSKEAQRIFKKDPDAFKAYHDGYKQQVRKWPLNPLDLVIRAVKKLPRTLTIADFGCGEGKLAKSVPQKVHSFDLVAFDDSVTACDMAHVPLENACVDLVVFCLSLMGTNLGEYLMEANRILKVGGTMKIVEVVSRFDDIDEFIKSVQSFGFKIVWKDVTQNYFYFLDFKKVTNVKNKKLLSTKINIQPCTYKKR